jgi:hypothetical protein
VYVGVGVGVAVYVGVGVSVGVMLADGDEPGVRVSGINGGSEGDRIRPTATVAFGAIGPKVAAGVTVANEILPDGASANAATPMQ